MLSPVWRWGRGGGGRVLTTAGSFETGPYDGRPGRAGKKYKGFCRRLHKEFAQIESENDWKTLNFCSPAAGYFSKPILHLYFSPIFLVRSLWWPGRADFLLIIYCDFVADCRRNLLKLSRKTIEKSWIFARLRRAISKNQICICISPLIILVRSLWSSVKEIVQLRSELYRSGNI